MWELAGGACLAVAVDVSDMWQVKSNTWCVTHGTGHLTLYTWHLTHDIWHMTRDTWHMIKKILFLHRIGATIRTGRKIQCLPCAFYFLFQNQIFNVACNNEYVICIKGTHTLKGKSIGPISIQRKVSMREHYKKSIMAFISKASGT